MLENLVGKRYQTLEQLKNDIEALSGKKVNRIVTSDEHLGEMDYVIDFEFDEFDIHTLFYLKDNGGRYYITEV